MGWCTINAPSQYVVLDFGLWKEGRGGYYKEVEGLNNRHSQDGTSVDGFTNPV